MSILGQRLEDWRLTWSVCLAQAWAWLVFQVEVGLHKTSSHPCLTTGRRPCSCPHKSDRVFQASGRTRKCRESPALVKITARTGRRRLRSIPNPKTRRDRRLPGSFRAEPRRALLPGYVDV